MRSEKRILKFQPNRVWRTYQGGRILDAIEGKGSPEDTHFPEDWIGSVVEARNPGREEIAEGLSLVQNGDGEAIPFRDLLKLDPAYFLGEDREGPRQIDALPLVKYLDSATRLHFQVHPTAEFARARLGANRGKTEAYVILATREDVKNPYVYAGFQNAPSREVLKQWILDQNIAAIEECFKPIPVKPGDVLVIPGGRPHALGEGIFMLEIMEASDLAVRFEFERDGFEIPEQARFMGRDIETALDVFNFDPVDESEIDEVFRCQPRELENHGNAGRVEELVGHDKTPCFAIRRTLVSSGITKDVEEGFIGIVTEGSGSVRIEDEDTQLRLWDRFYCPAGVGRLRYLTEAGMTVVECYAGRN